MAVGPHKVSVRASHLSARQARHNGSFEYLLAKYSARLDEPSKSELEREILREIVRAGKRIRANIRAMRKDIRKAIEAIDRSAARA